MKKTNLELQTGEVKREIADYLHMLNDKIASLENYNFTFREIEVKEKTGLMQTSNNGKKDNRVFNNIE